MLHTRCVSTLLLKDNIVICNVFGGMVEMVEHLNNAIH